MRHNVKGRKFNRNSTHRAAMMRNMATNLFRHGSIRTTLAKAKETKPYAEKLITRAIAADLADKRAVIEVLNDRKVAHHLINEIAPELRDRKGGYLRIIQLGARLGDGAQMAVLEIVGESEEKRKKRTTVKRETKKQSGAKGKSAISKEHDEKAHARDEQSREHLKGAKPKKQAVIDRQARHKTPPPSSQER